MQIKYGVTIENGTVSNSLHRLINLTYKLLPIREEGADWVKPLETIIEELAGMSRLVIGHQEEYFQLMCKMEGLFILVADEDFSLYRRTIFECLNLMNNLKELCQD